ncbi:MAG: hypothetical protein LH606_07170, partial [Cytophagaceae bacterium]|nr:hypothetical protein [Cytophagaceae bacterium]
PKNRVQVKDLNELRCILRVAFISKPTLFEVCHLERRIIVAAAARFSERRAAIAANVRCNM